MSSVANFSMKTHGADVDQDWDWFGSLGDAQNHQIWKTLADGGEATVVIYGTSLSASEAMGSSGEWVLIFREWAKDKFGDRMRIINSSSAAKNSQWGLENLSENVLAHRPDHVIIEFGMNDSYTPYGCTLNQVEAQIEAIISRVKASNKNTGFTLMSMNPKIEDATEPVAPGMHNLQPAFYDLYRVTSVRHGLDFVDHYGAWIAREKTEPGYLKANIKDGVHPGGPSIRDVVWKNMNGYLSGVVTQ